MKKNRNGFTLIELLATLVILAILALITTPIVLNSIKNTREGAKDRSADAYVRSLNNAVLTCLGKYPNKKVDSMKLIENGKKIAVAGDNNCADVETKGKNVSITENEIKLQIDESDKISLEGVLKIENEEFVIIDSQAKRLPKSKSLAEDSWDTIATLIKIKKANYEVGQTKCVKLEGYTNGNGSIDSQGNKCKQDEFLVRLSNKTTPEECYENGFSKTACGYVFEFVDIIEKIQYNPAGEYKGKQYNRGWNKDGYPGSQLYVYLQDENNGLYSKFPEDLKKVIIDTKVVSSHGSEDKDNFESTEKLYLLSTAEIWKQDSNKTIDYDTAREETRQLDYYEGTTTNSYFKAIKKYNSSADWWWLRSSYSNYNSSFYTVFSDGNWSRNDCRYNSGIAPAFRIG